jgi:hypothetical protein
MAKKSPKQRQKDRQHKAERKKRKRSQRSSSLPATRVARTLSGSVGQWPLLECWLTEEWRDTTQITQALVARRGPAGQVAIGVFLIDLGCLGVKDAYGRVVDAADYRQRLAGMRSRQEMVQADLNLVAKIIREAIAYADSLGFKPHRDYRQAEPILGNADPDACDEEIPRGKDGKPFYISGPYDNVDAIMAKLERAVGRDGFTYLVHLGEPPEDFFG